MLRNSSLAFWMVSILLGANLALISFIFAPIVLDLDLENEDELLLRNTWDFGVGGRYQPSSAHIDSNEKVVVILDELGVTDEEQAALRERGVLAPDAS